MLWKNEELNRIVTNYVRENNVVKCKPNLTASSFCQWVNDCLLPTHVLEPGYLRPVSVVTAHKWLHELGYCKIEHKKGTYIDGYDRCDVFEYRQTFLRRLCTLVS